MALIVWTQAGRRQRLSQSTPRARRRLQGLALMSLALALPAQAQDAVPYESRRLFAEIGTTAHDTQSFTFGASVPSALVNRPLWGGRLTGHWDLYLSHWRGESLTPGRDREALTQIAIVPTLRLRLDQGRSPWFVEGGIGASLTDSRYLTPHKTFSTRFNFADHIGLGLNFGPRREHELALRLQHVSNANIKKPNPGEDFLQLRVGTAF